MASGHCRGGAAKLVYRYTHSALAELVACLRALAWDLCLLALAHLLDLHWSLDLEMPRDSRHDCRSVRPLGRHVVVSENRVVVILLERWRVLSVALVSDLRKGC